jgi:hypothetical protein
MKAVAVSACQLPFNEFTNDGMMDQFSNKFAAYGFTIP